MSELQVDDRVSWDGETVVIYRDGAEIHRFAHSGHPVPGGRFLDLYEIVQALADGGSGAR